MCSPESDTFNLTFTTFLHLCFGFFRTEMLGSCLLTFICSFSEKGKGVAPACETFWKRANQNNNKKTEHHGEEMRPDGEKKSSVLPLFGNVNITKM